MWWTACVLALIIIAQMRLSGHRVIVGLLAATALVIVGNILRATILFFPESGAVHWPAWTHEATGALVFALCTWVLIRLLETIRRRNAPAISSQKSKLRTLWLAGACSALIAAITLGISPGSSAAGLPPLPRSFEGRPLVAVPLRAREAAFARGFPGRISVFVQDDRQILWREVLQPTRSLHSSLDCLRAAGWLVEEKPVLTDADGTQWGTAQAASPLGNRRVRERIMDAAGNSWTDVSSWWWAATLGRTQGPWTAITVIEP